MPRIFRVFDRQVGQSINQKFPQQCRVPGDTRRSVPLPYGRSKIALLASPTVDKEASDIRCHVRSTS